jgi:pSer/pThr/pTyr-binding forkhead associated (FHA) protein
MTEWIISLGDKVIKRFNIKEGWSLTIGRGAEADVIVDNTAISRQHTSIQLRDDSYMLTDLGSLNGTIVNGERIKDTVFVSNRDNIKLGKFKLAIAKDDENPEAAIASYGAHPDTEDKTIIINPNKMSTMSKGLAPNESDHHLVLTEGNAVPKKISLKGKGSIKIGKDQSCDMILSGLLIADSQCYIVKHDDAFKIVPQRSWAKTFLNGTKIKGEQVLRKGDIIKIRSTKIRFY